jgi:endonuclease YncB( thermonuclease family)
MVPIVLIATALLLGAGPAAGATVTARVTRVLSGDTILVEQTLAPELGVVVYQGVAGAEVDYQPGDIPPPARDTVCLDGVAAPLLAQPFGPEARNALQAMVLNRSVTLEFEERNPAGQIVGDLTVDGRWVNRELVAAGWAWCQTNYAFDAELAAAQDQARTNRLGLWRQDRPVPPWAWTPAAATNAP